MKEVTDFQSNCFASPLSDSMQEPSVLGSKKSKICHSGNHALLAEIFVVAAPNPLPVTSSGPIWTL